MFAVPPADHFYVRPVSPFRKLVSPPESSRSLRTTIIPIAVKRGRALPHYAPARNSSKAHVKMQG
jgi:hypothetical protein